MTELPEHELSRNCIDPRLSAQDSDQSLGESAHSMLFEAANDVELATKAVGLPLKQNRLTAISSRKSAYGRGIGRPKAALQSGLKLWWQEGSFTENESTNPRYFLFSSENTTGVSL